jgi:hypothetical protein
MRRLSEFITEDTNQFGPGTDLIVSLLAVLMVMTLIMSSLYHMERKRNQSWAMEKGGGNFKLSGDFFPAGDFHVKPVTKLTNPQQTMNKVKEILREYQTSQAQFPFIFVVGHSNQIDDPNAEDKSYGARLQRNWQYAGRRAGVIADLIQAGLITEQKDRIVVMTTGEFDLRVPTRPFNQENAWVEVVFGKEWKLPAQQRSVTTRPAPP